MNLQNRDQKIKSINESVRPSSQGSTRWNIQDLVKRTTASRMAPTQIGIENISSNRLAKKLVNIHQSVEEQNKTHTSQVMPSNKELKKRIMLDDDSSNAQ